MNILDAMFSDVRTIMSSIVIKYDKYAKQYETLDTIKESDRFMSASMKIDTFHTYQKFDVDAIINSGLTTDLTLAQRYADDKYLIPDAKREDVVTQQRRFIIDNYVEKNNYYRMLSGKPDMEDTTFIYIDPNKAAELMLDPSIPIHEYSRENIVTLEKEGVLQELKTQYPTKKYLNYLGTNSIDIVQARNARNFTILTMTKDISESLYEEFNNVYEQCREYFMSVLYIGDYGKRYDLYDHFMAMMIMVMTVQRLFANTFKYGIERDFYDLSSIQMMFESYNVPFIEDLPMEYQRVLVRNLNTLLHFKSTDKVLYDICSLLGFERINIYKYYLIKEHKLDQNENPIFVYKTIENEDGSTSVVEDPEQRYNLYFQTVDLKERNLALALSNNLTKLDYNQVVLDDPYWWDDDDELKKSLYEQEFNYVETKYLNMNIMYKLTEMLFEVMFVFRMMLDKKSEMSLITLELPRLFERKEINLFDITMFLCALVAKKNKLAGDIISTPSKTLSVMGFNFNADFTTIRKYIRDNPKLIDQKVLSFIENMDVRSPNDINTLFRNIKGFNAFVVSKLGSSQNINEYRAYRKIYDALMVTEQAEELFKKSDGTVATTFLDYLLDKDAILSTYVQNATEEEINVAIEHVLYRLNSLVTELEYLYILNDSNNVLLNAVITLIRFFKSYTTDLSSFNIMYLMNSRHYNMIKLITDIERIEANIGVHSSLIRKYSTSMTYNSKIQKRDLVEFVNKNINFSNISHGDKQLFRDKIKSVVGQMKYMMDQPLFDKFVSSSNRLYQSSDSPLEDKVAMSKQSFTKDEQALFDRFISMANHLQVLDTVLAQYADFSTMTKDIELERDAQFVLDKLRTLTSMAGKETQTLYDVHESMTKQLSDVDVIVDDYSDTTLIVKDIQLEDETMDSYDKHRRSSNISHNNTELKKMSEPFTDFTKDMSMYLNLLDMYSDLVATIESQIMGKDQFPVPITDKIELIWEA